MTDRDALIAALLEIERHVGRQGWDQPPRLFALVLTADLLAAEPGLFGELGAPTSPDALSSIEQDSFPSGGDAVSALAGITWPSTVLGCAMSLERAFLPAGLDEDIPADGERAAAFVAAHPQRHDVRVVVGVTRDGSGHGVGRLRSNPHDLLGADDLVPGLAAALARTLE